MLLPVLAVFTAMLIGALARRANWLTEEADHSLVRIVVRILFPALILKTTLGAPLLMDLHNVYLPPLVGFLTIVVGLGIAIFVARVFRRSPDLSQSTQRRTFAFCVGIYNYSYIPVPLIAHLFGSNTLAVLFVFNVGVEIAFWTVGIIVLGGHLGGKWYRQLLNAPTIAIAAALTLNFLGLHAHIPSFVMESLGLLGAAAIPLSLLLVGATIADEYGDSQLASGWRVMGLSCLLRLGVIPALFVASLLILPGTVELKRVIIVQAAMPAAVFPVVVARHYGGNPATAIRVVLATSIVSLLTMTLWLSAGLRLMAR